MKRQTLTHKADSGFTILETSVAMVVMLIAVLGSVSVFAYSIKNNSSANDRELAMAVAQQKLEQLRSVSFSDPSLTATTGTTSTIVRAGRSYTVATTIVPSNDVNSQPTVKTITVQVTPQGTPLGAVQLTTVRTTVLAGPNRY